MPRINPDKLLELLEGIHTMISVCYELSRNDELTDHLRRVKERLESMIGAIDTIVS